MKWEFIELKMEIRRKQSNHFRKKNLQPASCVMKIPLYGAHSYLLFIPLSPDFPLHPTLPSEFMWISFLTFYYYYRHLWNHKCPCLWSFLIFRVERLQNTQSTTLSLYYAEKSQPVSVFPCSHPTTNHNQNIQGFISHYPSQGSW
jgi:hypothetical protein